MINIFPEETNAPVFNSSSSSSKFFPKVVNDMPDFTVYNPEDHCLLKYQISDYIIYPMF
jgi:phenolic acid decarboxylase